MTRLMTLMAGLLATSTLSAQALAQSASIKSVLTLNQTNVDAQAKLTAAGIDTFVVIYEENRSFDNIFGEFPGADNLLNPLNDLNTAANPLNAFAIAVNQVDEFGNAYTAATLPPIYNTNFSAPKTIDLLFNPLTKNGPWKQELNVSNLKSVPYVDPITGKTVTIDATKWRPLVDVTGDLVHRYYQEAYQINGGQMNRFSLVSDSGSLTMSGYTAASGSTLNLWKLAQQFVLNDHFFHGTFGGSFQNHAWLACACNFTTDSALDPSLVSKPDATTGRPFQFNKELGTAWTGVDGAVTTDGKYWINTSRSVYLHQKGEANGKLVQPQTMPHLGDRLDAQGISWKYYAQGYALAAKASASQLQSDYDAIAAQPFLKFSYHHSPFAYFKNLAYGTAAQQAHLQDRPDLDADIANNALPHVVFYKPAGQFNMHPGSTSMNPGDDDLGVLVGKLMNTTSFKNNKMVIFITFDEHGGQWDHVAPPKRDIWGPGSRVPLVTIYNGGRKAYVDHTVYDTTSILKTIEVRWGLQPMNDADNGARPITTFLN